MTTTIRERSVYDTQIEDLFFGHGGNDADVTFYPYSISVNAYNHPFDPPCCIWILNLVVDDFHKVADYGYSYNKDKSLRQALSSAKKHFKVFDKLGALYYTTDPNWAYNDISKRLTKTTMQRIVKEGR